ncbi:PREDICTED: uncharacterized protein LOC104793109 isoform X1 [Camelina sativa]|uniref:Uncharacterized protein LOC104793109 isoform X1 n=1 Tax=Camelina sativa TaxID=90675 RepID=A0ABM0ZM55_CAMSA|nr:PREDICTED: uncharacterized protein LOC104793109 isoform X1 [Camelina sativa]
MNKDKCKTMPGLAQRNEHYSSRFWSDDFDGVSYDQLQKFWSELSPKAREELLRIDKQVLFEQARKNMCCSRCHRLLKEGFSQIVASGRAAQRKVLKDQTDGKSAASKRYTVAYQNPAIHRWGGLSTTREGSLTLQDCFLYAKSFKGLQTVFESAHARERERELLYPDACGGGGRVWLSQGIAGYGKGHGTRETCALHTTRLSCDTLVDFWSALEEESRLSLLRMKEEDFVERLNDRFNCKKFCRDCRRNVVREFKELKELKRMQREPRCTDWFCVADTAFQYQVDVDSVRADWSQYFTENAGYHQFEWAIGTGEGESDILEFKYVGNDRSAQVKGIDLRGLHECYITLRAFKKNGRSSEISVKAHALRGQQCVHSRLVVGDGFVSIKRGECIRMFFEHAEEAEEEEDEVMIDKDGNELDGECLRPQKHAKSPELAREFLLDAATVIFKEQVEKAFREGTARQNAHSIFVCLSSKLLEQRVHIACKEIVTLEKQEKLLEEEEKEKREEEERKERKRIKEREKKLRRKERLKEKEREKEQKNPKFSDKAILPNMSREEEGSPNLDEENNKTISCEESGVENGDVDLSSPGSLDDQDGECLDGCTSPRAETHYCDSTDREIIDREDENGYFTQENPRPVHQTARFWKEVQPDHSLRWSEKSRYTENDSFVSSSEARYCNDRSEMSSRHFNGSDKNLRVKASKSGGSPNSTRSHEEFQCSDGRTGERYGYHSCSCKPINGYREKVDSNISATRGMREPKAIFKSDSDLDVSKLNRANRYTQSNNRREIRSKMKNSQNASMMDPVNVRKVLDSVELKHPRNSSNSDISLLACSTFKSEETEDVSTAVKSADIVSLCKATDKLGNGNFSSSTEDDKKMEVHIIQKIDDLYSKDPMMSRTSSSDNCSSCPSEGDSNTASSNNGNSESSSVSDSEDAGPPSEGRENIVDIRNDMPDCHEKMAEKVTETSIDERDVFRINNMSNLPADNRESKLSGTPFMVPSQNMENMVPSVTTGSYLPQPQNMMFPQMLNQSISLSSVFQSPSTMGYYHQAPVSWSAAPANGLMQYPHPNHYVYTGPLGYSLNGESPLCVQYWTPLNHSAAPFFSSGPVPVFHPFAETTSMNTVDQAQTLEPSEHSYLKEADERKLKEMPVKKTPRSGGLQTDDDENFSLFHFGGPVALSTRSKSNPAHSKDGILGDFSLQFSGDHVFGDPNGNSKKEKENIVGEEYNLFETSNRLRFSIF